MIIKKKQKLELACLLSSADTSPVNMNVKEIKKRDVRNLAIVWNSKQESQIGDWEEEYCGRDFYKRKYTKSIFLGFPNKGQTFQINIGTTLKSSLADMAMASIVKEGFDQKHISLGTLIDGRRTGWFFSFCVCP